jgi:phage FluMu gp28-like protein
MNERNYFLPYQAKWIDDESPLKLYEKSRRVGITYGTSYRSVRKCLRQRQGSKFVQWVSSRDEKTAKEFVTDYVAMWCKAANAIATGLAGDRVEVVDDSGIKAFLVEFNNGSRIYSLTSSPKSFAGKGGDVLLDEFDLHGDQGALYDMAYPCITWGGQLEIVSAYDPDGSDQTVFAQLVKEVAEGGNPKGFSYHRTTLDDAIADGFVEKVNEIKATKGKSNPETREAFRQRIVGGCRTRDAVNSQYLCVPNRANGQLAINPNDLAWAKQPGGIFVLDLTGDAGIVDVVDPVAAPYLTPDFWRGIIPAGQCSIGYDVARRKDLATVWVDTVSGSQAKTYRGVALVIMRRCKYETQRQLVAAILRSNSIGVGAGDSTGMGETNCEALQTSFSDRFVGVNFSSKKAELCKTAVEIFEQHRSVIPADPAYVASDIAGVRKSTGESGRIIYTESANELEPDSHCDIAYACFLAKWAGETISPDGFCRAEPANATGATRSGGGPDNSADDDRNRQPDWRY